MKRLIITSLCAIALFSVQIIMAQDKPVGFASLSGNGLTTTTGGEGGQTIIVETLAKLKLYAASSNPYIIIVKGTLEPTSWTEIDVGSNTTIVGYGADATLINTELHMVDEKNIIIRNLTIRDSYVEGDEDGKTNDNDAVQADNCHHLWIDHCFFTHCGDGLIDLRKACDYVTVSWVHLSDHNKAFGIGWTELTNFKMTLHHNWIENTNQRNPSFDMGIGHLYNNYLDEIGSYGNQARGEARVVIENSVFANSNDPITISGNGVLYDVGNMIENCTGSQNGNASVMPYDPKTYYDYTLDDAADVKSIVTTGSGPQAYITDQYLAPSGIEPVLNKNSIQYFFNNNLKVLTLKTKSQQSIKLSVFSSNGKLILQKNLSQSEVSLKELRNGIYYLQFEVDGKIEVGNIVL